LDHIAPIESASTPYNIQFLPFLGYSHHKRRSKLIQIKQVMQIRNAIKGLFEK